jgi:biopolymer transport protein ExbB/TolQ
MSNLCFVYIRILFRKFANQKSRVEKVYKFNFLYKTALDRSVKNATRKAQNSLQREAKEAAINQQTVRQRFEITINHEISSCQMFLFFLRNSN